MSSQDNNRFAQEKQRGEQDRQKGLAPCPTQPSNTPTPYNQGYKGS